MTEPAPARPLHDDAETRLADEIEALYYHTNFRGGTLDHCTRE